MLLPLGVGNIQKGERCVSMAYGNLGLLIQIRPRYCNVDYVFASAIMLTFAKIAIMIVSYDIACQWFKGLFGRLKQLPPDVQLPPSIHAIPAIPKFHEPAHKEKDHQEFSLNLIKGAARTDGEGIERFWGPHNALGPSTQTMGPGTRVITLEDNYGDWNWEKYIGHGRLSRGYCTVS